LIASGSEWRRPYAERVTFIPDSTGRPRSDALASAISESIKDSGGKAVTHRNWPFLGKSGNPHQDLRRGLRRAEYPPAGA